VCATSRFPADTADKYALEDDYASWRGNLEIYGLDFRDLPALELFCAFLKTTYNRLDAIVNNACQTIRRPPAYYEHLMEKERAVDAMLTDAVPAAAAAGGDGSASASAGGSASDPLSASGASNLRGYAAFRAVQSVRGGCGGGGQMPLLEDTSVGAGAGASEGRASAPSSSELTQVMAAPGDDAMHAPLGRVGAVAFPTGHTDVNGQQVNHVSHYPYTLVFLCSLALTLTLTLTLTLNVTLTLSFTVTLSSHSPSPD